MAVSEQIFCLYHQKYDCVCINPVMDQKTLKMRLEHIIKLNEIHNSFEIDAEVKTQRISDNINFQKSLDELNKEV